MFIFSLRAMFRILLISFVKLDRIDMSFVNLNVTRNILLPLGGSEEGKGKHVLAPVAAHPPAVKQVAKSAPAKRQKTVKKPKTKKKSKGKKKAVHKSKKSQAKAAIKKKQKPSRQSSGCLASNCLDLAVYYIGLLRTKVTNYQKQTSRLSKLSAASSSKAGKQSVFSNSLNQLITAGGGNVSNLTCGTSRNNSGQ